jgi:farnesyl-diphosphate farnesyltransferase
MRSGDTARAAELGEAWVSAPPLEHEGYLELLAETAAVIESFLELGPDARRIVASHVIRTAEGMKGFVLRAGEGGELQLSDQDDLRAYCYVVAGIVGEMLTELFLLGRPELVSVTGRLRERAAEFGEGLQLTNILKDSEVDAGEGRRFLAEGIVREGVFALAREDLEAAVEYTLAVQEAGSEAGLVLFNAIPVALARATLDKVAEDGPGAKISRPRVWALVKQIERAVAKGKPALERRGSGTPA